MSFSLVAGEHGLRVGTYISRPPHRRLLVRPEVKRVAQHLRSSNPPSVVFACANVGFEHLVPPPLNPGDLLWGPTFFGFRLSDAATGSLETHPYAEQAQPIKV